MNILVINGSPHVKGTSALLMEEFIRGAQEKDMKSMCFMPPERMSIHALPVIHAVRPVTDACLRMEWKS